MNNTNEKAARFTSSGFFVCDGCSKKNYAKTLDFLIFVGEADTELITSYFLLITSKAPRNF